MQFTLPSVSSVPPEYQNGQLKVQKQVVGTADPNAEFSFDINIWSDDGSAQGSDYSIVRYNADGTQQIETTLLTDGKGTFKLKANEYVIIDYLQHGTHYTIKEANVPGRHRQQHHRQREAQPIGGGDGHDAHRQEQHRPVPQHVPADDARHRWHRGLGADGRRSRADDVRRGVRRAPQEPGNQPAAVLNGLHTYLMGNNARKDNTHEETKQTGRADLRDSRVHRHAAARQCVCGNHDNSGSITINDAEPGHTYNAYQVLVLESYDAKAGAYSYKANAKWAEWLKTQTQYVAIDGQGYVTWKEGADVAAFAKAALAHATEAKIAPAATKDAPAAVAGQRYSTVKFENLNLGYYLVDTTVGTLCSSTPPSPTW